MPAVRTAVGATAATVATISLPAEPVVWHFFGVPFQAGPLVVGLCAVAITRCIVFLQTKGKRQLALDIFVSLLCALVTAVWIQDSGLTMRGAGAVGIGVASVGIGIVGIARGAVAGRLKGAWNGFISGTPEQHRQSRPMPAGMPVPDTDGIENEELPDDMQQLVNRLDEPDMQPGARRGPTLPLPPRPGDEPNPYGD